MGTEPVEVVRPDPPAAVPIVTIRVRSQSMLFPIFDKDTIFFSNSDVFSPRFPLTAQTSAVDHHLCLKSAESVAVAGSRRNQTISDQPHQTHHHCHQSGPRGQFRPARLHRILHQYSSFSVHSSAFKQRSGMRIERECQESSVKLC